MRNINTKHCKMGNNYPWYVKAEIGCNDDGDFDQACEMIENAGYCKSLKQNVA